MKNRLDLNRKPIFLAADFATEEMCPPNSQRGAKPEAVQALKDTADYERKQARAAAKKVAANSSSGGPQVTDA